MHECGEKKWTVLGSFATTEVFFSVSIVELSIVSAGPGGPGLAMYALIFSADARIESSLATNDSSLQ
jgi:hypothetical protein